MLLAAAVAAGCGSSGSEKPAATATTPAAPGPSAGVPGIVPRTRLGPAVPAERQVIDRWLATLRRGDEMAAARWFAPGVLVQNGTPVLKLHSLAERTQFMRVLTCGAVDRQAVAAGHHFTIVTFLLTERPGGSCGGGTGHEARAAIRVEHGRITAWIRLPGTPGQAEAGPQVTA